MKLLTFWSSLSKTSNNNLSKLLATWMSILGDERFYFDGRYSPEFITLRNLSFSFVATINLSIGKPIFCNIACIYVSKVPVGTEKFALVENLK